MTRWIYFLICAASLIAMSCSTPPAKEPPPHIPAPWSYDGPTGPARWNKLDPEYATCGFGTTQSPIDITKPVPQNLPNIVFHYRPSTMAIRNTGLGVQADIGAGN